MHSTWISFGTELLSFDKCLASMLFIFLSSVVKYGQFLNTSVAPLKLFETLHCITLQ